MYTNIPMLHYKPSLPTYVSMKLLPSTTTTPKHSSKHSKSSLKITLYSLVTHTGNKSQAQEWVSPRPHPGPPSSTPSTNKNFYQSGLNMDFTTNTSSMMLSAFGYHTPVPHAKENYQNLSNNKCRTGMDSIGYSPCPLPLVTLWTSSSQLPMTKSLPLYMRKKQNLYLYIPPHSAHPPGIVNDHFLRLHCLCSH
ncbi:hypothetical protein ACHAW6_000959, partial [Cyclotella cf. meneghiniana]